MTAVEQFWKDVQDILPSSVDTETGIKLVRAYDNAKEMEKQIIAQAFEDGEYNYFYSKKTGEEFENGIEYYNETFKSE
jgi:hypothetical protein